MAIKTFKFVGRAKEQDGTTPGTAAEDQFMEGICTRQGIPYVQIGNPQFFSTTLAYAAAQTGVTLAAASGASASYYLTDIAVGSDTLGTISVFDNTTTSTKFRAHIPSGGSNFGQSFTNPIKLAANSEIKVTTSMTVSSLVICGFVAP